MTHFFAFATICLFSYDVTPDAQHVIKALEGEWLPESFESGGVNLMSPGIKAPPYPGIIEYTRIEIKGHRAQLHLRLFSKDIAVYAKIKIDMLKNPSRFEATLSKNVIVRGIFALDKNILLLCVQTRNNQKAPTRFNSLSDPSTVVVILRKAENKKDKKREREKEKEEKGVRNEWH